MEFNSFEHLDALSSDEWADVQAKVQEYEDSGGSHGWLSFDDYLPSAERTRWATLVELAHVALERRFAEDRSTRVEDYLGRYPTLANAPSVILQLAITEFNLRLSNGESPGVEEFCRRFPQLQEDFPLQLGRPAALPNVSAATVKTIERRNDDTHSALSRAMLHRAWVGDSIGRFQVRDVLGEGSFGAVLRAFDPITEREVALKVAHPRLMDRPEIRERFLREARAVAQLDHPNIVHVYDAGTADNVNFIASALVTGCTLREELERHGRLEPRRAADLVAKIATALHYAHARGIIHRDIKPENIMLSQDGEPKLMDFGLAHRDEGNVLRTKEGTRLGTPAYMSPEQARAESHLADARSDIWSMGVILYELLSGERPFQGALVQTIHAILTTDPRRPRDRNPAIPKDLDTICLKCLAKEPDRRFPSAQHFADELHRWQRGEPIHSRPISTPESMWRWAKRKPAAAGLISVIALALFAVAGVSIWYSARLAKSNTELGLEIGKSARATALAETEAQRAKEGQDNAETYLYLRQLYEVRQAFREGRFADIGIALQNAPASKVSWETDYLRSRIAYLPYFTSRLSEHDHGVVDVLLSPDGQVLVSAGSDGRLLVWEIPAGRIRQVLQEGYFDEAIRCYQHVCQPNADSSAEHRELPMYFSDLAWLGKTSKFAGASMEGSGVLFDLLTGERRQIVDGRVPLLAVASTSDGERALFGATNGTVQLWRNGTSVSVEKPIATLAISAIAWSKANQSWLVGSDDGKVRVLSANELTLRGEVAVDPPVWSIDVLDDDTESIVAIASGSPDVQIYRLRQGGVEFASAQALAMPREPNARHAVHCVKLADRGNRLYAADAIGRLATWNVRDGRMEWMVRCGQTDKRWEQALATQPRPFQRRVSTIIELSQDRVLTSGQDAVIYFWNTANANRVRSFRTGNSPRIVFDSQKSSLLWCLDGSGVLRVHDTRTLSSIAQVAAHDAGTGGLVLSQDLNAIITAGQDGDVRFWRLDNKEIVESHAAIPHGTPIRGIAVSNSGKILAAVDGKATLTLWETASGKQVGSDRLPDPGDIPESYSGPAFNSDDSRIAAFGAGASCYVYSTTPFALLPTAGRIEGQSGTSMMWHPDNPDFLLVGDAARRYSEVRLGSCELTVAQLQLKPPKTPCVDFCASHDRRRWFALEKSGRVVVLAPDRLGEVFELQTSASNTREIAIDASDGTVAVADSSGFVELFETRIFPADPILVLDQSSWQVTTLLAETQAICYPPCVILDEENHIGAVQIRKRSGHRVGDPGRIEFVREGTALRELVSSDAEVEPPSTALVLATGRCPTAIFRAKPAEYRTRPYDGQLRIATRDGHNDWRHEIVVPHGNMGFYPVAVVRDGIDEIFHFDMGGYFWTRSVLQRGEWTTESFGRQGDGRVLDACVDVAGRVHAIIAPHRFSGDPQSSRYVRVEAGKCLEREIFDPEIRSLYCLTVDPAGTPYVIAGYENPSEASRFSLLVRRDGRWERRALPNGLTPIGSLLVNSAGTAVIPCREAATERLLVARAQGESWSVGLVTGNTVGYPSWTRTFLDSHGKLVIVACEIDGQNYSLRVYRSTK